MMNPNIVSTMHGTKKRRRISKTTRYWLSVTALGFLAYWLLSSNAVVNGLLWIANGTKAVEVAVREGF